MGFSLLLSLPPRRALPPGGALPPRRTHLIAVPLPKAEEERALIIRLELMEPRASKAHKDGLVLRVPRTPPVALLRTPRGIRSARAFCCFFESNLGHVAEVGVRHLGRD